MTTNSIKASGKKSITKFTLAFVLTCLPIIASQPVLSQNKEQLVQVENLAQNRDAQDYFNLGNEFYDQGKLEAAIANYRQAIQLNPNDAYAYINLGVALYDQGKLEEAIANYRKAIQLDPNDAYAYINLGAALRKQGKLEEAIANYRKAIQLNPDDAYAYYNLGIALRKQGKLEEAVANYRQAIRLNPNHASSYYNLGNALSDQGEIGAAIANYERVIQLNPNYADAYINLGVVLRKQGKLDEAIANYKKAIQLNPNYADSYNNLGNALSDQGKLEEAVANYQKAIQLNPNYALSYNGLGYALQQQGKIAPAIQKYQRSLAIDPEFVAAKNNLREAERLLALKSNPPPPDIDDTKFLPSKTDEPLVNVLRSTARIIAEVSAEGKSIGAGWVVKKEDNTVWIVTNRHVISDSKTNILSKNIEVEFFSELPDTKRPRYPATIIQSTDADDHNLDLAALKVTGIPNDIKELKMRSGRVKRDANVRIIGHPFTIEDPWSASRGQILNYNTNNPKFVIDAYVAQGNSGGPVIDKRNRVIGIMVNIKTNFDIAVSSEQPTLNIDANQPATGGVGLAYRIDIVVNKLREWGIID